MMDISFRLNSPDTAAAQAPRLQAPPMRENTAETPPGATQVEISAEARAAGEAAASQQALGVPQNIPSASADHAAQRVGASAPAARAEASAAVLATPATPAEAANAARAAGVPPPSASGGGSVNLRAAPPDAASAASNQAVQLYLDNASRLETQPAPAAVRASA